MLQSLCCIWKNRTGSTSIRENELRAFSCIQTLSHSKKQGRSSWRSSITQMWIETRKAGKLTRKAETDTIQKLVEYAKGQGSSHAEMLYMTYSRLANKMAGINKRDEATVMQLNNLSLMENIILHEVDLGIMQGKHYPLLSRLRTREPQPLYWLPG